MRPPTALLVLALLAPATLAGQAMPIRFSFDAVQPAVGDVGAVIARRQQMRAWQDTVQVYLEQFAPGANVALAAERAPANYRVSIVAMPVTIKGLDAVAMAVVIFEPGALGNWKYLSHYVAFSPSAQEAAAALLRQTVESINAARAQRR